jgi:thioredoxin reductase
MNQQFDIIIIGDSKAGREALKHIASEKPSIKIAFISREFKTSTTRDYLNVEYINDEVIYTSYQKRLFSCYLKSGLTHYCTHLIIASGVQYETFELNNEQVPNVFNTLDEIPKYAKNQPALVVGNTDTEVKFALSVAKKYKQVYLCTKYLEPVVTTATKKKLDATKNIVVLPNTSIINFITKDGVLEKVGLDNYSYITCSAIFIKTKTSPETIFVFDKLISKDREGYLETDYKLESQLIPKCFAIGNCTKKTTKKMLMTMYEHILEDFKEEN